jgi:hypothetical protein
MYTKHVFLRYMMLRLQYMLHVMFFPMLCVVYFYISTFRSVCAVLSIAVFCSSLMSCFPGMRLRYFLNDSEMVPAAHIISGIHVVFIFHMRCISTLRSLESSQLLSLSYFHLLILHC